MDVEQLKQKAKELIKDVKPKGGNVFDKYLNVDFEVPYKCDMVKAIGLDTSPPKKVLDISTCYGWMAWVLKELGHDVSYTDYFGEDNDSALVREKLGLKDCISFTYKKKHTYERKHEDDVFLFKKLPDFGKFDVIVACAVGPHSYFTYEMWVAFIDDASCHLNENGFLYIAPNQSWGYNNFNMVARSKLYEAEETYKGYKIYV